MTGRQAEIHSNRESYKVKDTKINFEALVRLIEWQDSISEKEAASSQFLSQVFDLHDSADLGSYKFTDLILDLVGIPQEGEGGAGTRIDSDDYDSAEEYSDAYGFCRDTCDDLLQGDGTATERATTLMEWYEEFKSSGRW
jgi:hypothetical protein